jgi:hypothetical protein
MAMRPTQDLEGWRLSPSQIATVNRRSNDLGGEEKWVPPRMNLLTKTFKLKAVDFVRISRGAMSYLFAGVFDDLETENQKQAFESFNETLRLCLTSHFNEQVIETMSLLEMCAPLIIFDRLLHELEHMALSMLKWNSCRNYWAFRSERYFSFQYLALCVCCA